MEEKQIVLPQAPIRGGDSTRSISPNAEGTILAPAPTAVNEKASRLFAETIGRLPGVLRVERWGEAGAGTPVFHVYLRPDDRETECAVYEAKGQAYDQYPDAYLEVVVLEAIDAPFGNGATRA